MAGSDIEGRGRRSLLIISPYVFFFFPTFAWLVSFRAKVSFLCSTQFSVSIAVPMICHRQLYLHVELFKMHFSCMPEIFVEKRMQNVRSSMSEGKASFDSI